MDLTTDMYEYLTNFAADRDIINMLAVNKKFNDSIFFERVFKRKYPLLIKFKQENETWKHFYLNVIKHIAKLQEKYSIPYIPHPDFNPVEFYMNNRIWKKSYIQQTSLLYAIKLKDLNIAKIIIKNIDKKDLSSVISHIIKYTNEPKLIEFLTSFTE